jgi:phenylpropionate dioxygenase-like ring-hydroxylating dioxygenase large terminal subunit
MSRFPFPLPYGWFHVGYSADLAAGEIKPVRYFGRDLILWREEEGGEAHLQDAYCPHLGANIGVGGKVKGNLVQCPFHHWRFDGTGKVVEIDYAKRLNENACLRSYPVREHYGILMAWYHPAEQPPLFELPEVPEAEDEQWVGPFSHAHTVKTALQEMAENTADGAHFVTIHNHPGDAEYGDFRFEGPSMVMRSTQQFPSSQGTVEGTLGTDALGFGFSVTRYQTLVDVCMIGTTVPVDEDHAQQHFHVYYRNPDRDDRVDRIGQAFVKEVNRQFGDDIPIWENKIYRADPKLCDGDGPIARFRKWANQFYA